MKMVKKLVISLFTMLFALNCFSQDTDYKQLYDVSKQLNAEYKLKISDLTKAFSQQDTLILDLRNIISLKDGILRNDSLQIGSLELQKSLLNDNILIYEKQLNRQDKFWNKPAFGIVIGVIGTVAIINVMNYTLPH